MIPIVPIRRASRRTSPSGANEAIAGWSEETKLSFRLIEMNLSSAATIARVEVAMERSCSSAMFS